MTKPLALLATLAVAAGLLAACAPPASNARASLYGDSIAGEIEQYLRDELVVRGATFTANTFGGTAPCDWLDRYRTDVASNRYTHVFLLFVGNTMSQCMRDAAAGLSDVEMVLASYRRTVREMIGIATSTGARVHIVLPPPMDSSQALIPNELSRRLTEEVYRPLIDEFGRNGVSAVDSRDVLGTEFQGTAPCRPDEADICGATGEVPLRTTDGVHLCPILGSIRFALGGCPLVSPGARRLARLMASTV